MPNSTFAKAGFVLSLLSLTLVSAQARNWDDFTPREPSLKQSGHWEWTWDGTDALGVGAPAMVHYVPAGPARIIITGPDDMLEHLRVGQGQIKMQCDDCHFHGEKLDITVSGMALHNVALSGSGEIALGRLDQDRLNLVVSGSGSVSTEGRVDRMDLVVSGSGNAKLGEMTAQQAAIHVSGSGWVSAEGRIDRIELAISGSGKARLGGVAVRQADIHISGSGSADLTPKEAANVSIAGSGTVHMAAAPPRLTQSVTGSGGVRVMGN
jgi:autotransporter translocation and assembly factor TamB